MNRSLRIAVADDEPDMREYFRKILAHLGYQVVAVAKDGEELVQLCLEHDPDLVITDIKMPQLDGIEAATRIYQRKPVPVILVSAYHDAELIERAEADHVLGYLVKPIKQADLEPTIALTMRRFAQFQALLEELDDTKQATNGRLVVEKATDLLTQRVGLTPDEAFDRLRTLADEKKLALSDLAHMLLIADEAFRPPGR